MLYSKTAIFFFFEDTTYSDASFNISIFHAQRLEMKTTRKISQSPIKIESSEVN